MDELFTGVSVKSRRLIYTPSAFARDALVHLQEVGELRALQAHTSRREGLSSCLFFIVEEGGGQLTYGGERFSLHTGDCVFIHCMQKYSHAPDPDALWRLRWAHFYGPSMDLIWNKYRERGGSPVFTPKDPAGWSALLKKLYEIADSDDHLRDMRLFETLSSLLTMLMEESWNPEKTNRPRPKKDMQQVREYLDEHLLEDITLDELSERFFINKFYLTRLFRETCGVSINHYIAHGRITIAKNMLRFTDRSVREIGAACGYEDAAYFCRVFRKVEGTSPAAYRRMWQAPA